MPKRKTTHARQAQALCLARGLFRSTPKGSERQRFVLRHDIKSGPMKGVILIEGSEHLEVDDLRTLLALVALASLSKIGFFANDKELSLEARECRDLMRTIREPGSQNLLYCVAYVTLYRLAVEMGYEKDSPEVRKKIFASLVRMNGVNLTWYKNGDMENHEPYGFLKFNLAQEEGRTKVYRVVLNPLTAMAALEEKNFVHIDMDEVRSLSSKTSYLLYQHLCATVPQGAKRKRSLDSLITAVWQDGAQGGTLRKRRGAVRTALAEIGATGGWEIHKNEETEGQYIVRRFRGGIKN